MQSVAKHLWYNQSFYNEPNNYLFEMIKEIIFTNCFSELIHQVPVNSGSERPCRRSVFNPTLYLDTLSNAADKILKMPYEFYNIDILVMILTVLFVKFGG